MRRHILLRRTFLKDENEFKKNTVWSKTYLKCHFSIHQLELRLCNAYLSSVYQWNKVGFSEDLN